MLSALTPEVSLIIRMKTKACLCVVVCERPHQSEYLVRRISLSVISSLGCVCAYESFMGLLYFGVLTLKGDVVMETQENSKRTDKV